jgi:DNA-binding transcriptional LysR family regulator
VLDPTLLRTFRVVAQEESFTKAAERLHLTQSAVSAHVRRLEEDVTKPLFVRSTRSVALTHDGELLLGYARAILRLEEEARHKLSGTRRRLHLRVGASEDFMSSWLPAVLREFHNARPGVSVEVQVANTGLLLASMDRGELDLVIGSRCHGDQSGHLLWREPLVWAYSTAELPKDIGPLPLALFPEPCPYRDAALAALAAAGRDWLIAVVSPSVGSLRAVAASGFAVAPLNRSLLTAQLRALERDARLPPLPDVEFMVFSRSDGAGATEIEALTNEIVCAAKKF